MAESLVATALSAARALYAEATQATENGSALQSLTGLVGIVVTILERMDGEAARAQDRGITDALTQLNRTLQSIRDLVARRGRYREAYCGLRLAKDTLRNRANKVKAEIESAKQELRDAIQLMTFALSANMAVRLPADCGTNGQLNMDALSLSTSAGEIQTSGSPPWLLKFSDLQYKKTGRGKPSKEVHLGSGGFGLVFRAKYTDGAQGDVEVAVKEPHDAVLISSEEHLKQAFMREADILYGHHHRNVLTLYGAILDDDDDEPCFMLVTELLCETLEKRVNTPGLDRGEEIRIMGSIADGVAYLHSKRIIHRDIKPQNIMFDSEGTPKIIDFGLAKVKDGLQASKCSTQIAGTKTWMSPEKQQGLASTFESDVFSMALVFLFVITRQIPPEAQREREMMCAQTQRDAAAHDVVKVVARCLHPTPHERPSSAAVAHDLASLQAQAAAEEEKKEEEAAFESSLKSKNIGGIVQGLNSCAGNAGLQAKGFQALAELARSSDANTVSVAKAGGIQVVVRNMGQHSQNAEVQQWGCYAMVDFTYNNDDNKVRIGEEGGIEVIVEALRQHSGHAVVQEWGCNALVSLAMNDDNQVKIREEGGIEVIVEALRQHSGHAEVQEKGCRALVNLAMNAHNQVKIREEGGIEVIVEALRQHSGHAGVQEWGCVALVNLAANNADNKVKIAGAGGIEAILQAMRKHPTNAVVQKWGCWSLLNIGTRGRFDTQIQKQIKQAGAEATVEAAMAAPNATEITKEKGGALLEKLKKV